jgi:hypothetical protein
MTVISSTIADNHVGSGGAGGLDVVPQFPGTTTTLDNTIVALNTTGSGSTPSDIAGTGTVTSSSAYNLIGTGGSGGLTNGVNGNQVGVANPGLGALANNGGPTQTMALLAGSPALDAGSGAATTDTDQRGVPRGSVLDIGAYQATATQLTVAGFPSPATAGEYYAFTVRATDPFGQPSLDFNGPVTVSSSDPAATFPFGQSLVGGQGTFNAALYTPGVQSITAAAGGLGGSQTGIIVSGTSLVLTANQFISSPNLQYELRMQGDGNLVEYGPGQVIWDSGTYGNPGAFAVLQGDGNFVVYSAAGTALWDSGTYGNPGASFQLQDNGNAVIYAANGTALWYGNSVALSGRVVTAGQAIYSPDGQYELIMQGDGNLVEYGPGSQVIWDSVTYGNPGAWAIMQGDGNLVVYSAAGTALWDSGTYGHPGAYLVLADGGTLEIVDQGAVIWSV